ncbi:MAG: hypothetical protein HY508_13950 [Acidobacteria bacterium]|nr:hypothetical protein [Acidobacteriota bacterium]
MRRKTEALGMFLMIALVVAIMGLGTGVAGRAEPDVGLAGGQEAKPAAPAATKSPATTKKSAKASKKSAEGVKKGAVPTTQGPKSPPIIGRRDPFKLPGPPVAAAEGTGEAPIGNLPPGTRGLVISRLRLEGIVRLDTSGVLIAVVDTNANRAYFLRENDAVYNGVVSKITPDSVTFRENTLDSAGKVASRDVVLRLTQGPGA